MFTARYGLSPCIKQIRLVFITEVESVYSAVRTESLYIKQIRLVFITEMESVYSAVRTESLYIKQIRLVFITEVESVYSAVRTESLYKINTVSFYNRGGECLQRGTD